MIYQIIIDKNGYPLKHFYSKNRAKLFRKNAKNNRAIGTKIVTFDSDVNKLPILFKENSELLGDKVSKEPIEFPSIDELTRHCLLDEKFKEYFNQANRNNFYINTLENPINEYNFVIGIKNECIFGYASISKIVV